MTPSQGELTTGERELRPGDRAWVRIEGYGGGVLIGTVKRVSRKSATIAITSTIEARALFGRGIVGRA